MSARLSFNINLLCLGRSGSCDGLRSREVAEGVKNTVQPFIEFVFFSKKTIIYFSDFKLPRIYAAITCFFVLLFPRCGFDCVYC